MEIQHTTRRDASQAELLLPAPALPFAGITVVTAWRCSRWGKRKFWHQQVPALRKQTKSKFQTFKLPVFLWFFLSAPKFLLYFLL